MAEIQQALHQQQHLLGFLAAAASPEDLGSSDDGSRAEALLSLQKSLLFPQSTPVLPRLSGHIIQKLQQLLSDNAYSVRHAAGVTFGTLCALLISSSNGRANLVIPGNPADRFMAWALPQITQAGLEADALVALDSTREFLNISDTLAAEYFVPSVIRACQTLLEDETTSMTLLQPVLGLLTIVALKFTHCLQPHFADMVDLLLGWALEANLYDEDRRLITDTFFQFQRLWATNLSFTLNMLSKFVGDMEVLAYDTSLAPSQQLRRLSSLTSCFISILQATALVVSELGHMEYLTDSINKMQPRMLVCFANVARKFGGYAWTSQVFESLTFFAEFLKEKFSEHYIFVVDILFKQLVSGSNRQHLSAMQLCSVLQMNVQMMSAQGNCLLPSAAVKLMETGTVFSNLRLHPSRSVTGAVAAIYLYLLRHCSAAVASAALSCIRKEIDLFSRSLLRKSFDRGIQQEGTINHLLAHLSEAELVALLRFDLLAMVGSTCLKIKGEYQILRAEEINKFILGNLDPLKSPVQWYTDLQLTVIQALRRVSSYLYGIKGGEVLSCEMGSVSASTLQSCFRSYTLVMAQALESNCSLSIKLEILDWIGDLANSARLNSKGSGNKMSSNLMASLVSSASNREPKVRGRVASVFEVLLQAEILSPSQLFDLANTSLLQIGDPDTDLRAVYCQLLAQCASAALWVQGWCGTEVEKDSVGLLQESYRYHQKQRTDYISSTKQIAPYLRPQQVVCLLNYVSQRPQVLPVGWLQRIVHNCPKAGTGEDNSAKQADDMKEEVMDVAADVESLDGYDSSNLAALWCMIRETARHCITVRFRTHLGGPTQTFAALERMLLDIPQFLQTESSAVGTSVQLLPMRLLLELMEGLQKNIYNAYEGSMVLSSPPSSSVIFFRANKKVCEEWFARIREALMNASTAIHFHTATVHHSMIRLQDMRPMAISALREIPRTQNSETALSMKLKVQQEVFKVLRDASLALCRNHESDGLIGLQAWAASAFGSLLVDDGFQKSSSTSFIALGWMNGLAFQARGEYERAAAHLAQILQSEETLIAVGSDGVQFIIARIIESYVALSDWEALENWQQELQSLRAIHAGKSYAGALTTAGNDNDMNAVHAMARFDAGDVQGAWGYLDLTPQSCSELTLDPRLAVQRGEQMLLQAMLHEKQDQHEDAIKEIKLVKDMIQEVLPVCVFDGLSDSANYLMQLNCATTFERWANLHRESQKSSGEISALHQVMKHRGGHANQDCHLWLKVLRVHKMTSPRSEITVQLYHHFIRIARKHANFRLARRLLSEIDGMDRPKAEILYAHAQLLFSEGHHQTAILELWNTVQEYISFSSQKEVNVSGSSESLKATACLKLSSWLKERSFEESLSGLLSEMQLSKEFISSSEVLEEVIGAGVKAATLLCPQMGKAWFSYASWCYSHARSSLFGNASISEPTIFPGVLDEEVRCGSNSLTENEAEEIQKLIFEAVNEELESTDMDKNALLYRIVHLMQTSAGAAGFEEWDGESPVLNLITKLRQELAVLKLSNLTSLLNDLLQIWWGLRRRKVSLFGYAARGFLKYLNMSSQSSRGDLTLGASLFILHILQNYGVELEDSLQQGFLSVPPTAWQEIIPQLFACLSSHPEVRVRKQLEQLLLLLAKVFPWAIVYPTLVDLNASEGQPSEELEHILSSLVNLHPKLVQDVRVMIAELGAITVLWEEQWLSTLQDLHADVTRRIATLKGEAARVAENQTLSHAEKSRINASKYTAIMAPIVLALERRLTSTSRPPETPHELWFQEHFVSQLKAAIAAFKIPPNGTSLNDVWRPFDAIASSLANHHKGSSLLLNDVSPQLASLKSSAAPMPGLEAHMNISGNDVVTVAAFNEEVSILATKTKPKKVSVVGSDGQDYTYLLKGREDLRLDARIMQLLRAANSMLNASSTTRRRDLTARHYSVTPISGRAGLIQWVDNVTSIYSVYKAWQQRTQAARNTGNFPTPPVPRPSDMFYGKIIPALKEKGSRKVMSRRDWPQDVKRRVLLELMKETPRQLVYRELWCASDGLKSFKNRVARFSGSVAIMSMIGHVLGLGDRHLDNILIDFSSGEVVHIDYNVCFDKGLRLKIPEIVPFRLTQTIQAALGPTGVEGVFRANCEAVLHTLQRNKDLILMLLEAFIWDPLVEWMRGDGHDEAAIGGEERKGMELAVSLSLFASHVQENRVPLQEHHDSLLSTLPTTAAALQELSMEYERFERCSTVAFHVNQEKISAEERQASATSNLSEASGALEKARIAYELHGREFAHTKSIVAEAAAESSEWIEQHKRSLDTLRNGSVAEIQAIGQLSCPAEAVSLLPSVLSAGVTLAVIPEPTQVLCKEVDKEITQYTAARHEALVHAARTLQAYSLALQRLLPGNYLSTSRVHSWAQILQISSRQLTSEALGAAKRQALDLISRNRVEHDDAVYQKHKNLNLLAVQLSIQAKRVEEDRSELEASIDPDAEKKAKDRLMGIFLKNLQVSKDDSPFKSDDGKDKEIDLEERRSKVVSVLQAAAATMYKEVGEKVASLQNVLVVESMDDAESQEQQTWCFRELQEVVERCVLISDVLSELQHVSGQVIIHTDPWKSVSSLSEQLVNCRGCISGIEQLVRQMVGVVLPEAIKAALSRDPAVTEAFASLSQIRGLIDTTLEQVIDIEMQRSALLDLEKNYTEKVGEIKHRQSVLEVAAAGGRDHLSWEEAEELSNQEELCRKQLEQIQRAWSQRGTQASAILRKEEMIRGTLTTAAQRFEILVALDRDGDLHLMRGKVLLAAFAKLFAGMESLDYSLGRGKSILKRSSLLQVDTSAGLDIIWKVSSVLQDKTFFVWKVCVMDILLDSCVRDASTDPGLSLEQLISQHKRRLEKQLQGLLDLYLRERVAPEFLDLILKETTLLKITESEDDSQPVRRAVKLFREYCDVHETVRAAKAAVSSLKLQADEALLSLQNVQLETAQMEWLHDSVLVQPKAEVNSIATASPTDSSIDWWNRKQILENLRSCLAAISRATEGLEKSELTGMSAEEQLERTMTWACANTASGNNSNSRGIPSEFHEHLRRRQQLLWHGREQSIGIVRLCMAVLEFEASREGFLDSSSDSLSTTSNDEIAWQKAYQNMISRLEAASLTFQGSDTELKSAQKNVDVATANLTNSMKELHLISIEAETAARDLESATSELSQCINTAAEAVSVACKTMRIHSALTSEGVLMLEEVSALTEGTEGANDVHTLAKEAIEERRSLISDLKKVHGVTLPLEQVLPSVANIMNTSDYDSKTHLLQNLDSKVREALPILAATIPSLLNLVQSVHMLLTNLARAASADAVILHKAFEGAGGTQDGSTSQQEELTTTPPLSENDGCLTEENIPPLDETCTEEDSWEQDGCWISPPSTHSNTSSHYNQLTPEAAEVVMMKPQSQSSPQRTSQKQDVSFQSTESGFSFTDNIETTESKITTTRTTTPTPTAAAAAAVVTAVTTTASHRQTNAATESSANPNFSFLQSTNLDRHARSVKGNAVAVLRRVQTKLEGRDIDETGQLSVGEQVDHLLRQATSIDNLSNMYEGWTPWI